MAVKGDGDGVWDGDGDGDWVDVDTSDGTGELRCTLEVIDESGGEAGFTLALEFGVASEVVLAKAAARGGGDGDERRDGSCDDGTHREFD